LMARRIGGFARTAKSLARNPLGIVALFILLVYGIAGLVLGISASLLTGSERLPLIWFLVLFPVVVLGAFFRLVTHHHWKLYGPGDFAKEESFLRFLSPSEQKRRIDSEVEEIVSAQEDPEAGSQSAASERVQVRARHTYALAEELAFREIEAEFGVPISRNVAYGSGLQLDGVFSPRGVLTAIEVKFIRGVHWERRISEAMDQIARMPFPKGMPVLLVLVVGEAGKEARESIENRFRRTYGLWNTGKSVWFKVYDYSELTAKYGLQDTESL